jgi:hypothetical protein
LITWKLVLLCSELPITSKEMISKGAHEGSIDIHLEALHLQSHDLSEFTCYQPEASLG